MPQPIRNLFKWFSNKWCQLKSAFPDRNASNVDGKPYDFLGPPQKLLIKPFLVTALLLFVGAGLFRLNQIGFNFARFFDFDNGQIGNWLTSLYLGAVGSIIASFLFGFMHSSENRKLRQIQKVTDIQFLNAFLTDLQHFGQRICMDYHVNIKLSPISERPDLLLVSIGYCYHKVISNRNLKFTIARVKATQNGKAEPGHNEAFLLHECYFALDERDIAVAPSDDLYGIQHLVINSQPHPALERLGTDDTRIEYVCELPPSVEPYQKTKIEFEVQFPLEIESYFSINFELPTYRSTIRLDYGELAEKIQVVSQSFISPRFGPNEIQRPKEAAIHLVYWRWLLPKNGVVFCWWKTR